MGDMAQKKESSETMRISCTAEVECERHFSRNILAKRQMAEQLMAMGFSKESVARILHFD
jgi:hypothetical protein